MYNHVQPCTTLHNHNTQGETDIYDATKEELQRSIALYMPAQPSGAPNTTADDGMCDVILYRVIMRGQGDGGS